MLGTIFGIKNYYSVVAISVIVIQLYVDIFLTTPYKQHICYL